MIFFNEYLIEEIFEELLFVLSNKPLIKRDVETSVPLILNDFLFESCCAIESFSISGEMMETMNFDNEMLKRMELRDVNITDDVIQVVLKKRGDTKL